MVRAGFVLGSNAGGGEILRSFLTGFEAQPAGCTEGTGSLSCGVKRLGRSVGSSHHLAWSLKKVYSDNLFHSGPSWSVVE